MEDSSYTSSVELGIMNDPFFFQQWHASNSFDGFGSCLPPVSSSAIAEEVLNFKCSAEQLSQSDINRPFKQLKNEIQYSPNLIANNNSARKTVKPEQETWSPSSTLYFPSDQSLIINQNFIQGTDNNKMMSTNSKRLAHQSHDHILAERKRREKLSQRFIALSVLVPGLKKTDKASVLGDAVEYMKKLKEKVKILEEQTNKKKAIESVVFVKKYGLHESDESIGPVITETLPWVEARFSNKDVLVHVHCEKNKGVLEKIVLEIEKLHLSVVNSSVMTFGDSLLDITLIAQKDEDFTMSITQFIIELRRTLKLSM